MLPTLDAEAEGEFSELGKYLTFMKKRFEQWASYA
jgi:hypothetical protein